ncbi:hypothetical protein TRVL_00603 [Trypanosoma vivax]|uniref:Uncharacterized protein n=1 Tax=Trypanosoma vivax (strain Y486) TaxID=1055687 RepID=G0U4J2_TRYVY|nr:hypothetical protein TRVL_00603 [Trypanosoma vivax]CCC52356.1 conserved hypothetical protein [Trypanosoma vivax Y486]
MKAALQDGGSPPRGDTTARGVCPAAAACQPTSGHCASFQATNMATGRDEPVSDRAPCCCEAFTGRQRPVSRPQALQEVSCHHQMCRTPQLGVGDAESTSVPRSTSRHCFSCLPEMDELRECDKLEKRQRYLSVRAERKKMQSALYGNSFCCGPTVGFGYRSNTAHLLRYSRGAAHQQSTVLERERRRQELRREVEERKRDLCRRGTAETAWPHFDVHFSPPGKRKESCVFPFAYSPVPICSTESLKQHRLQSMEAAQNRNCGRRPRPRARNQSKAALSRTAKSEAEKAPSDTREGACSREARGPTASAASEAVHSPSHCKCVNEQNAQLLPPHCTCPVVACQCQPCRCCVRCPCGSLAERPPAALAAEPVSGHTEVKAKLVPPSKGSVKVNPESTRWSCVADAYGRRTYITDDAYLFRRQQMIQRLEQQGYLRLLPPSTRSPSAPLPEKSRKWTTICSTRPRLVLL